MSRNKKNNLYPCEPQFNYIKVGFKGSKLYRHVFVNLAPTYIKIPRKRNNHEVQLSRGIERKTDEEQIMTNVAYQSSDAGKK